MWSTVDYPSSDIDDVLRKIPEFAKNSTQAIEQGLPLKNVQSTDREKMNNILNPVNSHLVDKRHGMGGALILDSQSGVDRYLIQSTSFTWRESLLTGSSLYHSFVLLTDDHQLKNKAYLSKYPVFHHLNQDQNEKKFRNSNKPVIFVKTQQKIPQKREKLLNIWLNLLMAVPLHRQKEALSFFKRFNYERHNVYFWLCDINQNGNFNEWKKACKRVPQIINPARKGARTTHDRSTTLAQRIENNIWSFLIFERGFSMYTLIKKMKKYSGLKPFDPNYINKIDSKK